MVTGPDEPLAARSLPATDVVLVVASQGQSAGQRDDPLAALLAGAADFVGRAVAVGEQAASSIVNSALDRAIPLIVNAVLDRVDVTQVVLDRVDIDRIVARADLEQVIDRIPLVQLADYVIDEIDLPSLIRESTGGLATDALDVLRMQSVDVDRTISRLMDAILLRRGDRGRPGPGEPAPAPQADAG